MAHPTQSFPKGFYDINEASATATESFYAITCYVAGNIEVQGGGRFEYVDVFDNASPSDVAEVHRPIYWSPFTAKSGCRFWTTLLASTKKIPTEKTTIALAVGQTVYGDFTVVSTPASGQASVLAYYK